MTAIGSAAELASDEAAKVLGSIADDPVGFLIKVLRIIGTALLVFSFAAGVVGYYLRGEAIRSKAEAAGSMASIGNAWGRVGAQFSNLSALPNPLANSTANIAGPNPLVDLENAGSNVLGAAQGVLTDLGVAVTDLGQAIADIPPALVAAGQALGTSVLAAPSLVWNELVYGVGGTIANVLLWVFPYAALAGAALWAVSLIASFARSSWETAAKPSFVAARDQWAERQRKKVWDPAFQRLFRNPTSAPKSRILATSPPAPPPLPSAPAAPVAPAGAPPPLLSGPVPEPAWEPGKAHAEPAVSGGSEAPPDDPSGVEREDNRDTAGSGPSAPPDGIPASGPASTEETETILGDYPSAKERLRILMREKRGDPPEPDPESSEDLRISILSAPLEAAA